MGVINLKAGGLYLERPFPLYQSNWQTLGIYSAGLGQLTVWRLAILGFLTRRSIIFTLN